MSGFGFQRSLRGLSLTRRCSGSADDLTLGPQADEMMSLSWVKSSPQASDLTLGLRTCDALGSNADHTASSKAADALDDKITSLEFIDLLK